MVATPGKKKSKLTYADRVVRALSEHQRVHKKRAIHLATLRAQIRKDAETDSEQLGGQWSHWVSRAVNKLTEQRVLMPAGPSYYAFTEESKKALTTARRETITAAPGTPKRHVQEGHVWKSVSHVQPSPSRGTKRPRRSSVGTIRRDLDEDSDPETPTKSISRRIRTSLPNKKARRSSIKGTSRLTRAELIDLLHDVEDEGQEEATRLRDELEDLRSKFEQALHDQDDQTDLPDSDLLPLSRPLTPLTPLPAIQPLPSSPTTDRPISALEHPSPRPPCTVTRTESGSLIHHFSKRPTPAPSNPDEQDLDQNPFDCSPNERTVPHGTPQTRGLGLATPSLTPFIETSNLPANGEERDQSISALRTALDAKASALQVLYDAHDEVVREHAKLKDELLSREVRIAILQSELKNKDDLLAAPQVDLSVAVHRASELEGAVATLQKSLQGKADSLAAAEKSVESQEASIAALRKEKAAQGAKLAEYELALEDLKLQIEAREAELAKHRASWEEQLCTTSDDAARLRLRLEAKCDQVRSLEVRCEDLQARYEKTSGLLQAAEERVKLVTTDLTAAETTLAALSDERTLTATRHEAARHELAGTKIMMIQLQDEMTLSRDKLAGLEASNQTLASKLACAEEEAAAHREGVASWASNAATLQCTIEALNSTVAALRGELHAATERATALTTEAASETIAALSTAKDAAETKVADLESKLDRAQAGLTRFEVTVDELQAVVSTRDAELAWCRTDVDTKEQARSAVERELASSAARAEALLVELSAKNNEITDLQTIVVAAQETSRTLSTDLEQLKLAQATSDEQHRVKTMSIAAELEASETREVALRSELDAAVSGQATLAAKAQQLTSELDASNVSLQYERVRGDALQQELSAAVEKTEGLERQVIEWRNAKLEDDGTIRTLQLAFEKYHGMLRSQLAEAGSIAVLRPATSPRT